MNDTTEKDALLICKENSNEYFTILKAYLDGMPIQFRLKGTSEWRDISTPSWNFASTEYRVKLEEYRPYKGVHEFTDESIKHNDWIFNNGSFCKALYACSNGVYVSSGHETVFLSYHALFNTCTWKDGSRCGIKL